MCVCSLKAGKNDTYIKILTFPRFSSPRKLTTKTKRSTNVPSRGSSYYNFGSHCTSQSLRFSPTENERCVGEERREGGGLWRWSIVNLKISNFEHLPGLYPRVHRRVDAFRFLQLRWAIGNVNSMFRRRIFSEFRTAKFSEYGISKKNLKRFSWVHC